MTTEDEAERSRYARRPTPARPKGALEAKPNGIRPVGDVPIAPGPTPPPLDDLLARRQAAPKFEFRDSVEEPSTVHNSVSTVDEGGAFHIFSLILRALRKVDKPTRRRIIGLINELELEDR